MLLLRSNRTFMELKSREGMPPPRLLLRSNRTFMELKYLIFLISASEKKMF
mgnify:FL=1